jgi:hypothetical protein
MDSKKYFISIYLHSYICVYIQFTKPICPDDEKDTPIYPYMYASVYMCGGNSGISISKRLVVLYNARCLFVYHKPLWVLRSTKSVLAYFKFIRAS